MDSNQLNSLKQKLQELSNGLQIYLNPMKNNEKMSLGIIEIPNYTQLMTDLNPVLNQISKNGEYEQYDWIHLRDFLIVKLRDVMLEMNQTNNDFQPSKGESFQDELDVVLQFLYTFDTRPPFTLQRICELLINPMTCYKSSKKILFALEKLVNVSPIQINNQSL